MIHPLLIIQFQSASITSSRQIGYRLLQLSLHRLKTSETDDMQYSNSTRGHVYYSETTKSVHGSWSFHSTTSLYTSVCKGAFTFWMHLLVFLLHCQCVVLANIIINFICKINHCYWKISTLHFIGILYCIFLYGTTAPENCVFHILLQAVEFRLQWSSNFPCSFVFCYLFFWILSFRAFTFE